MTFAKNGAALIGDVVVPPSEVKVLRALVGLDRPATVPEIAKAMEEEFSDASLYSLLGRLSEKRRLVDREEVGVVVMGTTLRRVTWLAGPAATFTLKEELANKSNKPNEERGARPTAEALR